MGYGQAQRGTQGAPGSNDDTRKSPRNKSGEKTVIGDAELKQLVETILAERVTSLITKIDQLQGEVTRLTIENEKQNSNIIELKNIYRDLEKSMEYFNEENKSQVTMLSKKTNDIADINEKIKKMGTKTVDLEDRSRRDNLVFWNIPEELKETNEICEKKLVDELAKCYDELNPENVRFERVHRLGKRSEGKNRAVIAKMSYHKQKEYIVRNARCLSKSKSNMTVSEDFSKDTVDVRDKLFKAGKAAKLNFNHAAYEITHIKLSYRRLIVTYYNKASKAYFTRSYSERDIEFAPTNWFVPKTKNNR